jgi:hypothetical protein
LVSVCSAISVVKRLCFLKRLTYLETSRLEAPPS